MERRGGGALQSAGLNGPNTWGLERMGVHIRWVNTLGSINSPRTERRAERSTKPTGFLLLFEMQNCLKWRESFVIAQLTAQHFFGREEIVVPRLRLGGCWTWVKPAIHERPDEFGEQKEKKPDKRAPPCSDDTLRLQSTARSSGRRKRGPVNQLQRRQVPVVRFPLAEADGHPVAWQSGHPPAGEVLPPPPGGHFCLSTTAKSPDSVLMSVNTAAAAAAELSGTMVMMMMMMMDRSWVEAKSKDKKKQKNRAVFQHSVSVYCPS